MGNLGKTTAYLKRNGLSNTYYAAKERLLNTKGVPYNYAFPDEAVLNQQREASKRPPFTISILVPVYETNEKFLREMIESCIGQTYPGWELVLADASKSDGPHKVIESYSDERIKYIRLSENKGISENTNMGLKEVTGEYTALLDHDDLLAVDALFEVAACILKSRANGINPVFIYSDEDKCNGDGTQYFEPNIKPEFNLDYLLSNNYICHLAVFDSQTLKNAGFRPEYDGAQDHDVILRIAGKLALDGKISYIRHISKVLYHWRCHESSTAFNPQSKNYAYEAGLRAVEDFAKVEASHTVHRGFYHVNYGDRLFELRKDIGAIGGFVYSGNKITGGVYNSDGSLFCKNMNKHYSGTMHRAHCTMNVYALDIRNLTPNPALSDEYAKALYGYNRELIDVKTASCEESEQILWKWSKFFADSAREKGYVMLFDPQYTKGADYGYESMEDKYPVSVVIPNFNGLDYLKDCLDSIYAAANLPGEVIVVDNGSKDGSVSYIKEAYPDVKLIEHEDNLGFTGAVNHGISLSSYKYVFLLNNDTKIDPDCIKNLYEVIKKDNKLFSAGALMLSMDNPDIIDNAGDSYNIFGFARSYATGMVRTKVKTDTVKSVFSSCAGAAMYNKDIMREIGLLDDRHFAYLEDVDICYRALIYGYKNVNVRNAVVYHKGSAVSGSRHNSFKVNLSSRNAVMLAMKNMPALQYICNLPFLFAGVVIKSVFFGLKGLGREYVTGTIKGIGMSLSSKGMKHHVKFRFSNMGHYFIIQIKMILATFGIN